LENLLEGLNIPDTLPLVPIRDIVIFPYMVLPLYVGRESSIAAVDEALNRDRLIFLAAQKDPTTDEPGLNDIYGVGVVASVLRMLKMPDGRVKILVQGLKRGKILNIVKEKPYLEVKILLVEDSVSEKTLEIEALMRNTKELLSKAVNLGKPMLPDLLAVIDSIDDPGKLADIVAANLGLKVEEAQQILEVVDSIERLKKVDEFLNKEISILEVQHKILSRAKGEIDKSQREYF